MEWDQEVQRIAKLGSWSDAEGKVVVAAWRRSGEARAALGDDIRSRCTGSISGLRSWVRSARGRRAKVFAFTPCGWWTMQRRARSRLSFG